MDSGLLAPKSQWYVIYICVCVYIIYIICNILYNIQTTYITNISIIIYNTYIHAHTLMIVIKKEELKQEGKIPTSKTHIKEI